MLNNTHRLFFVLILFSVNACAQDTLFLRYGGTKITHVKEINKYEILVSDSLGKRVGQIPKNQVIGIRFFDGTNESFYHPRDIQIKLDTVGNLYNLGRFNARKYYSGSSSFIITALMMSAATLGLDLALDSDVPLIIGPVASIIFFSVPPNPKYIPAPNMNLLENPEYYRGFKKEVRRRKRLSVLGGFLTGLAVDFLIIAIASN